MVAHAVTTTRKGGRAGPPLARAALLTIINMIAIIRRYVRGGPACVVMGSRRPPLRNPSGRERLPETDMPLDAADAREVTRASKRKLSREEEKGTDARYRQSFVIYIPIMLGINNKYIRPIVTEYINRESNFLQLSRTKFQNKRNKR